MVPEPDSPRQKASGLLQRGELKASLAGTLLPRTLVAKTEADLDGKPELTRQLHFASRDSSLWKSGLSLLHRLDHGSP